MKGLILLAAVALSLVVSSAEAARVVVRHGGFGRRPVVVNNFNGGGVAGVQSFGAFDVGGCNVGVNSFGVQSFGVRGFGPRVIGFDAFGRPIVTRF